MSDNGITNGLTLEELAQEIAIVRGEASSLKAENALLSKRLAEIESMGRSSSPNSPRHVQPAADTGPEGDGGSDGIGPLSRRGALLALGGAAAGGVGMAIGSAFLGAEPAAADNGNPVLLGQSNSATATTEVDTTTGIGLKGTSSETGGVGVFGESTASDGVGAGVYGSTVNGWGVQAAASGSGYAVFAESNTGIAISAISPGDNAINGQTMGNGSNGVYGEDSSTTGGAGVFGTSNTATGVHGVGVGTSGTSLGAPTGVFGETNASGGYGVAGVSALGDGVIGQSNGNGQVGVFGYDASSGGGTGVEGFSIEGNGIKGAAQSATGVGVEAANTGGPSLKLNPFSTSTLPSTSSPGQFIVLEDGSLWYCYTTNEWVQLNNGIVPLPAPVRVIDTTSSGGSVGGIVGPLVPGVTIHTTSVLTGGANGIPAQALGVVGNFAISGVGGALLNGFGVATIFPAGVSTPGTANINSGAGCFAISNSVTVRFGTGADAGQLSIVWNGGGAVPDAQAFLDVTGYIL